MPWIVCEGVSVRGQFCGGALCSPPFYEFQGVGLACQVLYLRNKATVKEFPTYKTAWKLKVYRIQRWTARFLNNEYTALGNNICHRLCYKLLP